MSSKRHMIDWSAPDVLAEIVRRIQKPLSTIAEANEQKESLRNHPIIQKMNSSEVIFSSTEEINTLIEELVDAMKSKSLTLTYNNQPEIFGIYQENDNVREMCEGDVDPNKISKPDQDWLMDMEKSVFKNISQNTLNLNELSFNLAVSDRQLHRKVKSLLYLTPNKYVRILKLHKANEFIKNRAYNSISQLAYAVGYNDTHYFSRLFQGQYDTTPKELMASLA